VNVQLPIQPNYYQFDQHDLAGEVAADKALKGSPNHGELAHFIKDLTKQMLKKGKKLAELNGTIAGIQEEVKEIEAELEDMQRAHLKLKTRYETLSEK